MKLVTSHSDRPLGFKAQLFSHGSTYTAEPKPPPQKGPGVSGLIDTVSAKVFKFELQSHCTYFKSQAEQPGFLTVLLTVPVCTVATGAPGEGTGISVLSATA